MTTKKIANFISTFEHYDNETSGIKPYTIRDNTPKTMKKLKGATHIRIQRAYTAVSFTKKITHSLEWKDNIIVAWNPNEQSKGSEVKK